MRLTPVQRNLFTILKKSIDRAFAMHVSKAKRKRVDDCEFTKCYGLAQAAVTPDLFRPQILERILPHLIARASAPPHFGVLDKEMRSTLRAIMAAAYTGEQYRVAVERTVMKELHARATELELMAQMPPVRKERKARRAPATRAERVDVKVAEWERKLRYAKNKLATYRKKQKYYQKKGAVQA